MLLRDVTSSSISLYHVISAANKQSGTEECVFIIVWMVLEKSVLRWPGLRELAASQDADSADLFALQAKSG